PGLVTALADRYRIERELGVMARRRRLQGRPIRSPWSGCQLRGDSMSRPCGSVRQKPAASYGDS
ncbi:MAG: hypothetical protein ABJD11_14390, partial [Gemmatimonadota bacterium]